jgi:hypothetical protein
MKKITVTYGQDTPAYADKTLEVPDDATSESIIQAAKDFADDAIDTLVFEPSHDWTGTRIVSINTPDGTCIAGDIPIDTCAEDLGLVTQTALSGNCGMMAIIHEAERQGIQAQDGVQRAIELGDAMQKASTSAKDFEPFKLVVESSSLNVVDPGPPYVQIDITPALLGRFAVLAAVAEKIGVESMATSDRIGEITWGPSGTTYRMEAQNITVYPGSEMPANGWDAQPESASFVISGRPHNSSDLCKSQFININTLIQLAGEQKDPSGVLFYSEVGDITDLAAMWAEDQGMDTPTMG